MKLVCPDCGKQYKSGKFCMECGAKLQEVVPELVCPSCGYKVKTGKFCPECGTKLTEQVVAPKSTPKKKEKEKKKAERKFNEKDARFSKYYDKKGFPRAIPQEEKAIAIEELTPFANEGNSEAKMLLGRIFINATEDDTVIKGVKLLKEAEDKGDKLAYYQMGIAYLFGFETLVEQNLDEAERRLLEAYQEYQDVEIAGLLANLYAFTEEKCDYKKAFDYATIVAEDEDDEGYKVLGSLYLNGWGVKKNVNLALENYKMAAAFGNEKAMNQIGIIFEGNDDFDANPEQSFYWFNEAAKKGSDVGMFNLGYCYKNGFGVEEDVEQAAEWFKKSAELGNVDAMCELGLYYQETLVDFSKAKMWYQKAAELGNAEAMNKLAVIYADIENNHKEALKWFKKAMKQDNPWAYRNYAFCLWNGNGVKENKQKAMEMMQKAISLGHPDAEKELQEMQQTLIDDITIENVKFSTDGRKKFFVEFECVYGREFEEYEIDYSVYANNKIIPFAGASGCGIQLSNNREKFSLEIPDYSLKLKIDTINKISFIIEARQLDERWDGSQDIKIFPLIASSKKDVKLYYEYHIFGKNKFEIRK